MKQRAIFPSLREEQKIKEKSFRRMTSQDKSSSSSICAHCFPDQRRGLLFPRPGTGRHSSPGSSPRVVSPDLRDDSFIGLSDGSPRTGSPSGQTLIPPYIALISLLHLDKQSSLTPTNRTSGTQLTHRSWPSPRSPTECFLCRRLTDKYPVLIAVQPFPCRGGSDSQDTGSQHRLPCNSRSAGFTCTG